MWGVLSLVRQGLRRRRTGRVVDESALGHVAAGDAGADVTTVGDERAAAPRGPSSLARALLAMACAVRLEGEDVGGAEEAWAANGWRPRADEVSHLMVRESMRYTIYA